MQIDRLFLAAADPPRRDEDRTGDHSPSPLRHYVLRELPADLRAVSTGDLSYRKLANRQESVLDAAADAVAGNEDPHTARVTQLDLLFMLGGYLPGGPDARLPDRLNAMIADQGARFADLDVHMSYELIIDVNCREYARDGDIRVFTGGTAARHERDFYLGHSLAEPFVRAAALRLRRVVADPGAADVGSALAAAAADLAGFKRVMARFGGLPRSVFAGFRRYLTDYSGGARGASGAFMPGVQLVELALLPPTDRHNACLDESMAYFPAWSRPEIARARAESCAGRNLADLVGAGRFPPGAPARVELLRVLDEFIDFRMIHLGVTRRHLPEAFAGRAGFTRADLLAMGAAEDDGPKGTSGFGVRDLLVTAAHRLLALRERLIVEMVETVRKG